MLPLRFSIQTVTLPAGMASLPPSDFHALLFLFTDSNCWWHQLWAEVERAQGMAFGSGGAALKLSLCAVTSAVGLFHTHFLPHGRQFLLFIICWQVFTSALGFSHPPILYSVNMMNYIGLPPFLPFILFLFSFFPPGDVGLTVLSLLNLNSWV